MAKQDELKNLVRERGLHALGSSFADETPAQEEEIIMVSELKPKAEEKPLEPKFAIKAIIPGEDDLRIIRQITGGQEIYCVVWKAYTCEGEAVKSNIELGKPISFKINCAASKLLAQLEARCQIEIIVFDARSLRPERLYNLVEDQKLQSAYFQISYTTEALLKGLYKLHVILSVQKTDFFHVYDGIYFQVA